MSLAEFINHKSAGFGFFLRLEQVFLCSQPKLFPHLHSLTPWIRSTVHDSPSSSSCLWHQMLALNSLRWVLDAQVFNSSNIGTKLHWAARAWKIIPLLWNSVVGSGSARSPTRTKGYRLNSWLHVWNYMSNRIIYMSPCTRMPVRIMQIILGATIHFS